MKYIINYKLFESVDIHNKEINVYDAAWLYFLCYVYDGEMKITTWENDTRMKGTTCNISLSKFDCVRKGDEFYTHTIGCEEIVNKWFGGRTFKEALLKKKDLIKYDSKLYTISSIPYKLFLTKNPSLDNAFDRIRNRIVDHYNSQRCNDKIIHKLSNSRRIKEFNFSQFIREFPDSPDTIKVYRGVKREYNPTLNEKGYSCWTYSKSQAERFAKYHFTGQTQFRPIHTNNPHILETEVNIDDIVVFISGSESEIILKNPVNIQYIHKLNNK